MVNLDPTEKSLDNLLYRDIANLTEDTRICSGVCMWLETAREKTMDAWPRGAAWHNDACPSGRKGTESDELRRDEARRDEERRTRADEGRATRR